MSDPTDLKGYADFDLHGCTYEPFSGFNEEVTYLERVTCVDRAEARRRMEDQLGDPASDYRMNPQPIHMRYVVHGDPELAERRTLVPDVPCWLECAADHPDAVPFWKDDPSAPIGQPEQCGGSGEGRDG